MGSKRRDRGRHGNDQQGQERRGRLRKPESCRDDQRDDDHRRDDPDELNAHDFLQSSFLIELDRTRAIGKMLHPHLGLWSCRGSYFGTVPVRDIGASTDRMSGSDGMDRRELAKLALPKATKWPRTERRAARVQSVLARRQPDLTVVLENVHDPHNVSAVLRSCDAVGVLRAHGIYSVEPAPESFARTTSASAAKWVDVAVHENVEACYHALRRQGLSVCVTAIRDDACDLYDLDLTLPLAFVFGNEMRGASPEAIELADRVVTIPMLGMVESLNISVACAVTLFEAMRQRRAAGHYQTSKLDDSTLGSLTRQWLVR